MTRKLEKPVLNNKGRVTGQREIRPVWNNAQRVNHQNKFTHPHPKRNFVPTVVVTKLGQVPVNAAIQSSPRAAASISTARPVNIAAPKSKVNDALPKKYSYFKAHSPVRRAFNQKSAAKTNNLNEKVKTARVNNVTTARPKAVVSVAMGNGENAVKSSACWIWRPTGNVIDHTSKDSGSYMFKRFDYGNPQYTLQDQGIFDSGCSRHMTGNKSFLTDYQEVDGGFVAFAGSPKGGKITGKGKIRTGKLDFEDTECLVLSPDFKLLDESQVLLKVPRQNNMYSFDLKNVVPSGGLTCLFAKAIIDESNLWHRRLGHINFKTMNKLVRGNLVRGLPSKLFENNHTCVACQKGKQHKASCKTKLVSSISQPLQMLHMDLFGPTSAEAVSTACYVQNRVLVTKPHNKTPYELLHGRPPSISFMRPFGCPVTILNTLDPLGKFNGKADEGFLVGYSINSKAFTTNRNACIKDNVDTVPTQQYILLPFFPDSPQNPEGAVTDDAGKKTTEEPANEGETNGYANSTNRVSTVSPSVSATGQSFNNVDDLPINPLMPDLEDTIDLLNNGIFSGAYDDEDMGATVDLNNLETTMNVSPIPTTKIHKDHPKEKIIRCMLMKHLVGPQRSLFYVLEFEHMMHKIFRDKFLWGSSLTSYGLARASLIETNKALLKDEEAEDVDVHLYRSMIGSLIDYDAELSLAGNPTTGVVNFFSWQKVLWIQIQMLDYGFNFMNTKIYIDNESTICIVKNPVFHSKTKNIKIRHHFIRDSYEKRCHMSRYEEQVHAVATSHPQKTQTPRQAKIGRDTEIPQSGGPPEKVGDEDIHKELGDRVKRAATTAASLDTMQDSEAIRGTIAQTRSERVPTPSYDSPHLGGNTPGSDEERLEQDNLTDFVPPTPYDSPLLRGHTPGSDEGRPNINELMAICTNLSNRVLALETSKTAQDLVINKLKKKVKRLEKKQKVRTPRMKLFKIGTSRRKSLDKENVSKQGRNLKTRPVFEEGDFDDDFDDIDDMVNEAMDNVEGDTVNTATTRVSAASASATTTGVSISTTEPRTPPTTTTTAFKDENLTIAQTLVKMRSQKDKEKGKGVAFRAAQEESARLTRILPTINPKDKGKGIMQEPEKPPKNPRKAQIQMDEELAMRLHKEEKAALGRMQSDRAAQEEASNAALNLQNMNDDKQRNGCRFSISRQDFKKKQ
ncbi:ribonuclease H-like domain-containing protein [Tanacetum coccineum]|uniref:Ribonuclease H-like domain-containing protein n=1 Tax=Tanacetum coccineum TaxID=301880 RepID=A0ABQ5FWK5_9ASTR